MLVSLSRNSQLWLAKAVMGTYDWIEAVGTHLPALVRAVVCTTGPVLECGVGRYSTPILHELCRGRALVSVEDSLNWLRRFADFTSNEHAFRLVSPMREVCEWDGHWGVVLVDCGDKEDRKAIIEGIGDKADLVVVHDTEVDGHGRSDALDLYPYRWDYTRIQPHTAVLSKTMDLGKLWGPS